MYPNVSSLHLFAVNFISKLQSVFSMLLSFSHTSKMEEDRLFDERVSIRESARPLKKYGSTCNHMKRNEEYIKHVMSKGDTLQGLALKYGVTVSVRFPSQKCYYLVYLLRSVINYNVWTVLVGFRWRK